MKTTFIYCATLFGVMASVCATEIWINEFHYDNAGGDVTEFVEIVAPSALTDLSTITLHLYNGGNGKSYGSHTLNTFTPGVTSGDYTVYSKVISGIQNGGPDGFSLDQSGTVLQFLTYEGVMSASDGPALGLSSTDIGVSETGTTPIGSSLGLIGIGTSYLDFTWSALPASASPGLLNPGQEFVIESGTPPSGESPSAVPESNEWVLLMAGAVMGLMIHFGGVQRREPCPARQD